MRSYLGVHLVWTRYAMTRPLPTGCIAAWLSRDWERQKAACPRAHTLSLRVCKQWLKVQAGVAVLLPACAGMQARASSAFRGARSVEGPFPKGARPSSRCFAACSPATATQRHSLHAACPHFAKRMKAASSLPEVVWHMGTAALLKCLLTSPHRGGQVAVLECTEVVAASCKQMPRNCSYQCMPCGIGA